MASTHKPKYRGAKGKVSSHRKMMLSNGLLRFAVYEKNRAKQIEEKWQRKPELIQIHAGLCISCLFMLVAFLEAQINEFLSIPILNHPALTVISRFDRNISTLQRYQAVAEILSERFDEGKSDFQKVRIILILRNMYTHFIPKFVEYDPDTLIPIEKNKLESMLMRYKLGRNPMVANSAEYFPHGCLSAKLCTFGIDSIARFVIKFYKRVAPDSDWPIDVIRRALSHDDDLDRTQY